MREVAEINLKDCVARRVEVRHHFGKTFKFVTHCLDVEKLLYFGEEEKHIRRTVLFHRDRENEIGNFCDIDIIDAGDNYLVTCCEHMYIKMGFVKGEKNAYLDDVFVSGDLKCFLLSKDDMFIAYLLQHMALTSQGAICTLLDSKIEEIFITSILNLHETIEISKEFVVKNLINILNNEELNSNVLRWNKYMTDIKPKTVKVLPNVKNIICRYDASVIPDNPLYKKDSVFVEGITVLTLMQEADGSVFDNTIVSNVIARNTYLPAGTQVFIKNEDSIVDIYLESIDSSLNKRIRTGCEITTNIRVFLYIPIGTIFDFQTHFYEKNLPVHHRQLYEIFKKAVREKIGAEDFLNAF